MYIGHKSGDITMYIGRVGIKRCIQGGWGYSDVYREGRDIEMYIGGGWGYRDVYREVGATEMYIGMLGLYCIVHNRRVIFICSRSLLVRSVERVERKRSGGVGCGG